MKRYIVLVCALASLTLDASAAIKQGDYDYEFNFRWSSDDGTTAASDRDVFEIGMGIAKQVTRRIQLGVAVGHEKRELGTNTKDTTNYLDFKLRYHIIPERTYVPYVGFIYRWYDRDYVLNGVQGVNTSDTAKGLLLGLRREITRHNDIYAEFQHLSYGSSWPVGNFDTGNKILIGLIHQIR